jgi:hypothetical protein
MYLLSLFEMNEAGHNDSPGEIVLGFLTIQQGTRLLGHSCILAQRTTITETKERIKEEKERQK